MTSAVTYFRALADPTRWRIVRLVMDQALCVCELADILGMPQSSVSSHVQVIRRAGLLESETCAKWTYFRIAPAQLPLLRSLLKSLEDEPQHATDLRRCRERLQQRAQSCCPGPMKLARRRATTNH